MTGTGKLRSTARVALVIAVFGGAWSVRPASAEPTFLSKQYPRCPACHYSAAGGGLLTPYGRSLSREEISTFGRQGASGVPSTGSTAGEEGFLFDALSSESPLQLGLDVRRAGGHLQPHPCQPSARLARVQPDLGLPYSCVDELPSVALTQRFLALCEHHGSQHLAVKLVAVGRSTGIPGLPQSDDWTTWDARQMRAAVEYLERLRVR